MSSKLADLLLLITAILWGAGYIGADILIDQGLNPLTLIGFRFLIASVVLLVIFYKKIKITSDNIKFSFVVGSALFLAFVAQTIALEYTTTTNVSFLTGINIIFVPILSFLLYNQKMKLKHGISLLLTVLGIAVLTGGMTTFNYGDFLTLVSAFFFGLHIVLISHFSKKIDIIVLAIGQMMVVSLLSFLVMPFVNINIIHELKNINLIILLFVGLIPSALCFTLQNIGLKYTDPSRGSIILVTESLWGAIFSILLLGEKLTICVIMGGVLLLSAIMIDEINLKNKKG